MNRFSCRTMAYLIALAAACGDQSDQAGSYPGVFVGTWKTEDQRTTYNIKPTQTGLELQVLADCGDAPPCKWDPLPLEPFNTKIDGPLTNVRVLLARFRPKAVETLVLVRLTTVDQIQVTNLNTFFDQDQGARQSTVSDETLFRQRN